MNFNGAPLNQVGSIDESLPIAIRDAIAAHGLLSDPAKLNYKTTALVNDQALPWWCRIDGSLRQGTLYTSEHYPLIKPTLDAFFALRLPAVSGRVLCAWSLSRINPGTRLSDHTDGILRFRFCDRYIIPLSNNSRSYNYYKEGEREVRVHFKIGGVYRLNNLVMHGAVNDGDEPRDNLLLDVIEERVWHKYKHHPDMYALISPGGSPVDKAFFQELLMGEVRAHKR